jgi:hypothetical protein
MKTINEVFRGLWKSIADPFNPLWKERKEICSTCPLNVGGICRKNLWLSTKYIENQKFYNRVYNTETLQRIKGHIIPTNKTLIKTSKILYGRGCGCILWLKQRSKSRCPLKFW